METLQKLRNALVNRDSITLLNAQGQTVHQLAECTQIQLGTGQEPLARDDLTAYKDTTSGDFYPLDSIYFAYLKREASHAEYFQECQKLRIKAVSLIQKRDLFDYLTGTTTQSKYVDADYAGADGKRSGEGLSGDAHKRQKTSTAAVTTVLRRDRPAATKERVLVHRNNVTSCSSQKTFDSVRRLVVDLFLVSKSKSIPAAPSTAEAKTSLIPIIIVPAALTTMLTLFNAKMFFEKSTYQTTEDGRKAANGAKTSPVVITHANPRGGPPLTFHVVDGVERMSEADWSRVVAVFVSGHQWQFRGWKWEEPVEIFSKIKGFYLKFADMRTDDTVKQWNVTVLEVNRYKRHLDTQCVYQFWSLVDKFMISAKPHMLVAPK